MSTAKKLIPLARPDDVGLGIGRRSIGRRIKSDPEFAAIVVVVNGRNYAESDKLEAYKQKLIERGLRAPTPASPTAASESAA